MSDSGALALILGFFGSFFLVFLALIIFGIIINWKLFNKAGKPGWASIVPVYNMVILSNCYK